MNIRKECLNFAAVAMEWTWWLRNRTRLGESIPTWPQCFVQVNRTTLNYWKASQTRRLKRTQINRPRRWTPPLIGWMKVNFDFAYLNGIAHPAVIIRNSDAILINTWVNETNTDGPFAVEASAAVMALTMAESLLSDQVIIEGDALVVIQSILKKTDVADWRGAPLITDCQNIILRHPHWHLNFISKHCNQAAHNLAAWAVRSSFYGFLPPEMILPEILDCDSGGNLFFNVDPNGSLDELNG